MAVCWPKTNSRQVLFLDSAWLGHYVTIENKSFFALCNILLIYKVYYTPLNFSQSSVVITQPFPIIIGYNEAEFGMRLIQVSNFDVR